MNILQGCQGALAPWHKITLAKQMIVGETQKTRLVSPQPTFYMTDFVRSIFEFMPQRGLTFDCLLALKFN